MDNVKPWQVVVIIAAFAVCGFSVWKFAFGSGPELPNSVLLVDVNTGDLFSLDISGRRVGYYPEKHPDTGERSLLPVAKQDDGTYRITGHSLPALEDVKGDAAAVDDRAIGLVRVNNASPRKLSR